MRMRIIKNAPYEGPGRIAAWGEKRGHDVVITPVYDGRDAPAVDSFDWLVVMGAPMGVHDEQAFPWLIGEKKLIEQAIAHRRVVLGVCLGAQLIAHVLGADVRKNAQLEWGWHTIRRTLEARDSISFGRLPPEFTAFLWHGDVFDVPIGARPLASSDACANQAFEYDDHVVGLQFHLEVDPSGIADVIDNSSYEGISGPYVQTREEIFGNIEPVKKLHPLMDILLDDIEKNRAQ